MIIQSVDLETVCGITSRLPDNILPEFAFYGKSNVGKSSLINALINRKNYARTSQEPGKTQTINFYNVNRSFYFVDLPGYGYARVSKELQVKWLKMIEKYLKTSRRLKRVFLLIDMRHEPSANDILMADLIRSCGFEPVFILTKADKLSRNEQARNLSVIRKKLALKEDSPVIPFSAVTKDGRDRIRELIQGIVDSGSEV